MTPKTVISEQFTQKQVQNKQRTSLAGERLFLTMIDYFSLC